MKDINKRIEKNNKNKILKLCYVLFLLLAVTIVCVFNYKHTFVIVSGSSMEKSYSDGEIKLADKNVDNIERFDCIVIFTEKITLIKRVVGMPGDHIEYKDNVLYVNGSRIVDDYKNGYTADFETYVSENCYFCLGDNREHSLDSRYYGEFNKNLIIAEVRK